MIEKSISLAGGNKSDGPVKASVEGDESKISKEAKPASDANAATV